MTSIIPSVLYKYRCIDTDERTISMLAQDQLYFAQPSQFNDPFDCRAQRNQLVNFRENVDKLMRTEALQRGLSDIEINATLEKINQNPEVIRSRKESDENEADFRKYIDEETGIFSLTSCNNSILMWSHYADYHRGFCIGFNVVNFRFPDKSINQVKYVEKADNEALFRFCLEEDESEDRFIRLQYEMNILLKYRDWQYEKEWRIMGRPGLATYPSTAICEIIFGLKCSEEHKIKITDALGNKAIKYFQAVEGMDDFAINIIPIE